MNAKQLTLSIVLAGLFSTSAIAQSTLREIERNVNQQERIEQGLQSGQLTTREASRLEREEARVETMQSRALSDGRLDPREAQRINAAQNQVSRDIYQEKHDAQLGNPNSASSQRMQADVQRNINQQQRVENGIRSGQLTNREVSQIERRQAQTNRMQARAGADGHVGRNEQRHIQMSENRHSNQIYKQKHDGQQRNQGHQGRR